MNRRVSLVLLLVAWGSAADLSAQDVLVYSKPLFAFVLPSEDAREEKPIRGVTVVAARGEYEAAMFVVHTPVDLKQVTVRLERDLTTKRRTLFPKGNVDIRVVKVWKQFPPTVVVKPGTEPIVVPELLVKDDTVAISDGWRGRVYLPPSFPSEVRTDIPAGTSKQFWLTVWVPEESQPGVYRGSLEILANRVVVKRLPLTLRILPFRLPKPKKTFVIYFRGRVSETGGAEYLPESIYLAQLKDIKAHGFSGVTIYETEPEAVEEAFRRVQKVGLEGPIVQMVAFLKGPAADLRPFVEIARRFGYTPFFLRTG